jgi:hypothetical protein
MQQPRDGEDQDFARGWLPHYASTPPKQSM